MRIYRCTFCTINFALSVRPGNERHEDELFEFIKDKVRNLPSGPLAMNWAVIKCPKGRIKISFR